MLPVMHRAPKDFTSFLGPGHFPGGISSSASCSASHPAAAFPAFLRESLPIRKSSLLG